MIRSQDEEDDEFIGEEEGHEDVVPSSSNSEAGFGGIFAFL